MRPAAPPPHPAYPLKAASGTFVIQHGATTHAGGSEQFAMIVPGSGTGELAGPGRGQFTHDANGAVVMLDYELA